MKHYPARIGIKAGGGIANLSINNEGELNDKHGIPSWHAGIYFDKPILPLFSIQVGAMIVQKGAAFTIGNSGGLNYTEVSTRPVYLELPLAGIVRIPIAGRMKLLAGAGPYLAVGLAGKNRLEGRAAGISFSDDGDIDFAATNNSSGYNGDLKRFDAGINVLAGVEIGSFTANAGYGHGLMNIKSGSDHHNSKYAHRVVSISAGLLF